MAKRVYWWITDAGREALRSAWSEETGMTGDSLDQYLALRELATPRSRLS